MPKMLWSILSLNDLFLQSKKGILCTIARQHRHVYRENPTRQDKWCSDLPPRTYTVQHESRHIQSQAPSSTPLSRGYTAEGLWLPGFYFEQEEVDRYSRSKDSSTHAKTLLWLSSNALASFLQSLHSPESSHLTSHNSHPSHRPRRSA